MLSPGGRLRGAARQKALANIPILPMGLRGRGERDYQPGQIQVQVPRSLVLGREPLVVARGKRHTSQTENRKTCRFTFTLDVTFTVSASRSRGAFAGGHGPRRGADLQICCRLRAEVHRGQAQGSVQRKRPAARQGCGRVLPG